MTSPADILIRPAAPEDADALKAILRDTFESTWPSNAGYGPGQRPRSATIAIRRKDGKPIGV